MTKVSAVKKTQASPHVGAVWPLCTSEHLMQVPDKPMRNIRYIDKEIKNLKKDLLRSRFLIQAVKIGRGYFTILREETAMKKRQQQLQRLQEEERNKFQPAKKVSEILYGDSLLVTHEEKFKKLGTGAILRPFTPVHSCILSSWLPEAHIEPLFRQLCALHWLLEALTIDHTHHTMKPLITCWNPKDPGGSKSTVKKINKDKYMGQRWDHFITAPKTKKFKIPCTRTTCRKPSRRGSMVSLSRISGGSSPQSSMVSINPSSDEPQSMLTQVTSSKDIEDNESSSTKLDEEVLHINLQKLLEIVREHARRTILMENGLQKKAPSILSVLKPNKSDSALKDGQTTHKSSERSGSTSAESHTLLVQKKSKRRQEERGLQKFDSFVLVSNQKDLAKMRHSVAVIKGDAEEIADHWYFDLLSKLPEDLKNFLPAKKVLLKLQKFGENLDLRIRPHILLKVLQELRVWELCSPDIAVAIEFVREHIIHMPQEDYISWLQGRLSTPIRPHSTLA
uniref:Coiled-coil domain containing 60 n=1 Tax=Oryctolagus cuniculus TaxID=9986 RepID=G1SXN9_RABIT